MSKGRSPKERSRKKPDAHDDDRGTDKAKDAEARGVEAFTRFLSRVLMHADELARELRLSLQPTYPLDTAAITLVKGNCAALRWLLNPVVPGPGPHDLDALSGYGVEPITLRSFFACNLPNRDTTRAAKWLLNLAERIDRNVTREQRPTAQVVQELEEAVALLRKIIQEDIPAPPRIGFRRHP
ncbi:MAG: hypothetical protein WBC53_04610 [Phycisphaerae bacterium]